MIWGKIFIFKIHNKISNIKIIAKSQYRFLINKLRFKLKLNLIKLTSNAHIFVLKIS